jgi:protocatechuate 3,4-dioxygenase beta subunit
MKNKKEIKLLSRRELIALLGGGAAISAIGCSSVRSNTPDLSKMVACVVSPEQTAGPYFVDEKLNRRDIRSDPKNGKIKPGAELELELRIMQVSKENCVPLAGAVVDIWHCDANGIYSDVEDFSGDTRGQKFLRGYQVSDKNGMVNFKTIYPGWYEGRTVHIHYKVRVKVAGQGSFEHTSQLYFDEKITTEISKLKPYRERESTRVSNQRDGIFRGGGTKLMLDLRKNGNSYLGKYSIGLNFEA